MIKELLDFLSPDGLIQFLARQSNLSSQRVARIFRLGEPWPLAGNEACSLGVRVARLVQDSFRCVLQSATQIVSIGHIENQLMEYLSALARGSNPLPILLLESVGVQEHIIKTAELAGEKIEREDRK
jgi:hypothetical protein